MQETRNNYFGSKKRNTALLQAKIDKHACRKKQQRTKLYAVAKFEFMSNTL